MDAGLRARACASGHDAARSAASNSSPRDDRLAEPLDDQLLARLDPLADQAVGHDPGAAPPVGQRPMYREFAWQRRTCSSEIGLTWAGRRVVVQRPRDPSRPQPGLHGQGEDPGRHHPRRRVGLEDVAVDLLAAAPLDQHALEPEAERDRAAGPAASRRQVALAPQDVVRLDAAVLGRPGCARSRPGPGRRPTSGR